jgi:hypothetical protein
MIAEHKENHIIDAVPEEKARIRRFLVWCRENGASFDKIKIRYRGPGDRAVFATRDLVYGETVVVIPDQMIFMRKTTPLTRKITDTDLYMTNANDGKMNSSFFKSMLTALSLLAH